jgi:hypothetical protein
VSQIRIAGSQNRISTIEMIEPEGDRSVMNIAQEGR